jgi:hypothetical protein
MASDQLKTAIARVVINALTGLEDDRKWTAAGIAGLGADSIEVHDLGNLTAVIRVKTQRQGVRYFAVKVSEPV